MAFYILVSENIDFQHINYFEKYLKYYFDYNLIKTCSKILCRYETGGILKLFSSRSKGPYIV